MASLPQHDSFKASDRIKIKPPPDTKDDQSLLNRTTDIQERLPTIELRVYDSCDDSTTTIKIHRNRAIGAALAGFRHKYPNDSLIFKDGRAIVDNNSPDEVSLRWLIIL